MKTFMNKINFVFTVTLLMLAMTGNSQNKKSRKNVKSINQVENEIKCTTVENELMLQRKFPNRFTNKEFENWLAPKIEALKSKINKSKQSGHSTTNILTIPVVVHVIHNGDPVGVNENISDAQIQSQITVLNQDFRRMPGTPGFNSNPVGADSEIEFCLASRDPEGLPTNGIVRYNLGSNDPWEMDEINTLVKPQTQWNPNEYLNIWVVNQAVLLVDGTIMGYFLGFAQFPSGSGLEGLEDGTGPAETDGVVVSYKYFGSAAVYPAGDYDLVNRSGRTATHEIGHFLGLIHTWGDGGCGVDDFCLDTPMAGNANIGCPNGADTCPTLSGFDMIENYMDYTNDNCKNIFTQDQKNRMTTVLTNATRRASLLTSPACLPGQVFNNDGSLQIIETPSCSTTFSPSVRLTNRGNSVLNSAQIVYNIDNNTFGQYNWSGTLSNGQNTIINLPSITTTVGSHVFTTSITTVNGVADENDLNNSRTQNFEVNVFNTEFISITILTDGFAEETTWELRDINNAIIASGGPYENNTTNNSVINVIDNQCYTFEIFDSFGDGICCFSGQGNYTITTSQNEIVATGGDFFTSELTQFGIEQNLNISNQPLSNIIVYPNPTNSQLNIQLPQGAGLPDYFVVYNTLGQEIDRKNITVTDDLITNISNYSAGIYYLKIVKENQTTVIRFVRN